MARLLDNWLKAYLDFTAELESPESFHLWTGLIAISSVLRRRVWIDIGPFFLWPNLFVIFVAPAGAARKGIAIKTGATFLREIPQVTIAAQSLTRERLVKVIQRAHNDKEDVSALTLLSAELSDLFASSKEGMLEVLTSLYDYPHREWSHETIGRGEDKIINPTLTFLGATTPSWIASGLPKNAFEHGFARRTIFIYEAKARHAKALPHLDPLLGRKLLNDLQHIATEVQGEFTWKTTRDKEFFTDEWYPQNYEIRADDWRVQGFYNVRRCTS